MRGWRPLQSRYARSRAWRTRVAEGQWRATDEKLAREAQVEIWVVRDRGRARLLASWWEPAWVWLQVAFWLAVLGLAYLWRAARAVGRALRLVAEWASLPLVLGWLVVRGLSAKGVARAKALRKPPD